MGTLANLVVKLSLQDELTKGLSGVAGKLNGLASDFRKVGAGLTAGVTVPLVAMGTQLVSAASDLNEAQSAVNTVFGDSAKAVNDYAQTSATALGVSQAAYLQQSAALGALFTGLGKTQAESADFSTNILQNASDLASFYNTDPGTALADLQSGLIGEAEPLRKYGILLTEAAVQQKAMEQTGKSNAKQLTESEKVTARYALIQEQLGAAQGDFARTSGGLANQQRILRARLQDTAAQMGQILLPYVLKAVKGFSDLLTRFQKLSPQMQKIIVIVAALAAALGPLLLVIGTLIPAITALIPLFGLLLGPLGLVIAAVALLTAAYFGNWFGFADAVNAVVDAFGNLLASDGVQTFLEGLATAVERPINALKKMGEAIIGIGAALLSGDFKGAIEQAQKLLEGFGDFLASPAKAIGQFLKGIETGFAPLDNVLHTVGKLATDWGRLIQEIGQGDLSGALDVAGRMFTHFGDLATGAFDLIKAGWNAIDWNALASAAAAGLKAVGSALIRSILAGWDAARPMLASYAFGLGSWVLSRITNAASALKSVGSDLLQGVMGGWDEKGMALAAYAGGLPGWVFDQIKGADKALYSIGEDLVQGLIDGITSKLNALKNVIHDLLVAAHIAGRDPMANYQTQYQNTYGVNPNAIKPGDTGAPLGSNYGFNLNIEATPQSAMGSVLGLVSQANKAVGDLSSKLQDIGKLKVPAPDTATFTIGLDAISTTAGTMVGNVAALMGQNTANIGQAMSDALSAASTYSNAIYTVVSTNIGTLVGNTSALMGAFKNAVGQGFSDVLSAAATYSAAVVSVTQSAFGQIPGIVASALSAAASTAYAYGANIGNSLAAGMASALGVIQATAAQMAAAAEAGVAARAKIASPSKVFIGLGQSIGDGFAIGIENRYADASRAGNGLAASAIPGIGGAGSGAGGRAGFTNYGTIRVEAPSPEDFYQQWRQQQMGGVRR